MITRFRAKNYKALRDVTVDLTPIHVLIGPNDSGKTSILDAIAALCRSVDHDLAQAFTGSWSGRSLVWRGERNLPVSLGATFTNDVDKYDYDITCQFHLETRFAGTAAETFAAASQRKVLDLLHYKPPHDPFTSHSHTTTYVQSPRDFPPRDFPPADPSAVMPRHSTVCTFTQSGIRGSGVLNDPAWIIHDALAGVHYFRWVPRFLALPVAPDAKRRFRMEPSGFGLALCLDDILSYDRDRFIMLEGRFRESFPHIKSVKLIQEPAYRAPTDDPEQVPMLARADGKGIYFEFVSGGELVPASQVSDGILLVLAYLTVLHLPSPPRLVLVEEPENGIHPKRLQDVLKILRDLVTEQAHTQVILTTHSPYVVDLFEPDEVSLCQMAKDGSVSVRRLSQSKTVREQLDVFTLGEIWTAEGDEALARSSTPDEAE